MPRIARVVVPHFPHHIIQRGNRRQRVFFNEGDYQEYLNLLHAHSKQFNLEILAYCLMPNHVHLIVTMNEKESIAQAIGKTHLKYTRMINCRENWRGYLWQGRFSSYVLDEHYLLAATRYILLNPVKAGIIKRAWDYKWSSTRHHLGMQNSPLITNELLNSIIGDWKQFLKTEPGTDEIKMLNLHERTGRPLGDNVFIKRLEKILKKNLKKKKPGPQKK